MIAFPCPSCGRKLTVKEELAGKKGKCRQCQEMLTVPHAVAGKTKGRSQAPATGQAAGEEATLPPATVPGRLERDAETMSPTASKKSATVTSDARPDAGSSDAELYDFLAPAQAADELGRLGSYRVLKLLGAGGMGAVFQAEDPQLQRLVALKVMLPALAASESARKRFLREARAAS